MAASGLAMKEKKATRRTSYGSCPEGMMPDRWQKLLRRQAAEKADFIITPIPEHWSTGSYNVTSPRSRRHYTTIYHGEESPYNSCQCMDFRTNGLGTCKHIEAVALRMPVQGWRTEKEPERTVLDIDYRNGRRLRLRLADITPQEVVMAAMRFFDDDFYAVGGMVSELPSFIQQTKRLDSSFHVTSDALTFILEERDRLRREHLAEVFSDAEIDSVLRTTLYPYQTEGIRKAFAAGRSLLADEMGLGKTVQALGTAELLRQRNMADSVLVVCPTSLKYQWKKEIERFTGASATIIEGPTTARRELYGTSTPYKIVSYHTLANDIKTLGKLSTDVLLMDEVQRLKNWNTQISQAVRRIDSEYAVVISGTPLDYKLEELYSVMQFVDQYAFGALHRFISATAVKSETGKVTGYRNLGDVTARLHKHMIRRRKSDVALQLPERTDKTLFVPMTREQKELHDEAMNTVAQLVNKWQRYRFLSEKDRKRLLLQLSRMRMVCDSTYVLDLKTRFDTKVGETVQLIRTMTESNDGKAVIFSQWERMTHLIAQELDNEGIRYEYHNGSMPASRRGEMTERFMRDPDIRVFLSTDAGATGLNLQCASTIINLDLPWNPAMLEQRIARIHRIGQRRNIQVINFVAAGTIEERMLTTLKFRQDLFSGIMDGGEDSITLDDTQLSRIADSISVVMSAPEEPETQSKGTVAETEEDEPEVKTQTDVTEGATIVAPDELIRNGMSFISGLVSTLESPEATERLLNEIVHTDESTGKSELHIPIPDRESVGKLLRAFTALMGK